MRKTLFGFGLAVAAFFVISMAAPPVELLIEGQQRINGELVMGGANTPVRIKGPLFLDSSASNILAYTASTDGGVGSVSAQQALQVGTKALINYDFPSLSSGMVALATACADSSSVTIANCPFGSQLHLGVDQALVNGFGTVTPYLSAANTAFVRACSQGITDGGSFNMPDASYIIRCTP